MPLSVRVCGYTGLAQRRLIQTCAQVLTFLASILRTRELDRMQVYHSYRAFIPWGDGLIFHRNYLAGSAFDPHRFVWDLTFGLPSELALVRGWR